MDSLTLGRFELYLRPPRGAAVNDQKTPDDARPKGAPDVITAPVGSETRANLPFLVVGIGASAGGLQALEEFFENVTIDSGMAYVVVQHLSPDHTSLLGEILVAQRAHPGQ